MMHSNLTRWIEDADAREVFLQSASMCEPPNISQHQHVHLGQNIKKVFRWWHQESNGHLLFSVHGHRITRY